MLGNTVKSETTWYKVLPYRSFRIPIYTQGMIGTDKGYRPLTE